MLCSRSFFQRTGLVIVAVAIAASQASADVVLFENFDNGFDNSGGAFSGSASGNFARNASGDKVVADAALDGAITTANSIFRTSATANVGSVRNASSGGSYPAGPSASSGNYLHWNDGSAFSQLRAPVALSGGVFTLSFDYYEPTLAEANWITTGFVLSNGNVTSAITNRAVDVRLSAGGNGTTGDTSGIAGGNIFGFNTDTWLHFDIVGNLNATGTVTYGPGGIYSVAAQTYDIFINGAIPTLASDNRPFGDTGQTITSLSSFYITQGSGSNSWLQSAFVDNIVLLDVAQIPEPNSLILVSVGLIGLFAFRMRPRKS